MIGAFSFSDNKLEDYDDVPGITGIEWDQHYGQTGIWADYVHTTENGAAHIGRYTTDLMRVADEAITGVLSNVVPITALASIVTKGIKLLKGLKWAKSGSQFGAFFGSRYKGYNVIPRTKSVLGHIFRNIPGHVNPGTAASQSRYIKLFESVANNSKNLNPSILNSQAAKNGVQAYTQTFRNGKQVWVHTRNGRIFDAGINLVPR